MLSRRRSAAIATPGRAQRLVRSLVGVADALILTNADGAVAGVRAVPEEGCTATQLVQNVRSGLLAGLGIRLPGSAVVVAAALDPTPAAEPPTHAATPPAAPPPGTRPRAKKRMIAARGRTTARDGHGSGGKARSGGNGRPAANGHSAAHGNGTANGNGHPPEPGQREMEQRITLPDSRAGRLPGKSRPRWRATVRGDPAPAADTLPEAPAPRPPLRVEDTDLERLGNVLRCRIVISMAEQLFAGMAESPAGPGAEVQLGARVTVDALRAGGYPEGPLQLMGASTAVVANRPHALVSLKWWTDNDILSLAGSAPVTGSLERAAAEAVLQAIHIHVDTPRNGRAS